MLNMGFKLLSYNTSPLVCNVSTFSCDVCVCEPSFHLRDSCFQVEALQAQMEEQTRLTKEQVESLLEDRRIKTEEAQAQRDRDQERTTALTDK